MRVYEIDPGKRDQVRKFLNLPFHIYADIPQWVPPLRRDARSQVDPGRNPFFEHSEAVFLLAEDQSGSALGRLCVMNNRRYNQLKDTQTGFFYLFESIDDRDVSNALFSAGLDWARGQGLSRIVGPKGFVATDGLGMLIEGFEHRPAFGIPYNPPYYPALVEAAGFAFLRDLVSGYVDRSVEIPDRIFRISRKVAKRKGLQIVSLSNRQELREIAPEIKSLYNSVLGVFEDNVPLSDAELDTILSQMIWFADPELIKIVRKDGELIGFAFGFPDISAALQRNRGRLFPFGWLDLLLELRRTKWVNLNGGGIVEEHQGMGGTAILLSELTQSLLDSQYQYADLVQIRKENHRMLREVSQFGIDFYKTHRMYQQEL
ncbi:MAG: hypothetical protein PVI04_04100 [Anaerolineales bacterium]|jgi:hypothetical protein